MELKEAALMRHMVRKYEDKAIPADIVESLNQRIEQVNNQLGVSIKLITNDNRNIWGVMRLLAKNVKNYFIMAGDDNEALGEHLGYAGADLMLYAQTLGLNTWWIGLTFSNKVSHHVPNKRVMGIVAVGYGATQGEPHKSKKIEEVSSYDGDAPDWFTNGVKMALLAPTAMNQQGFNLIGEGNSVKMEYLRSPFATIDAGLVKYHFELGAGKENFEWKY